MPGAGASLRHHPQEVSEQARIIRQLRMEDAAQELSLPDEHRAGRDFGKHFHAGFCARNDWRADENAAELRLADRRYFEIGLEAVDLSPEGVPADGDLQAAEPWQPALLNLPSQEDQAGAGTIGRHPGGEPLAERLHEFIAVE